MKLSEFVYSLGWYSVRPLEGLAGLFSSKLASALAGRKTAVSSMRNWAKGRSDEAPLLWVHGASAGELVGAEPVLAELRRLRPDLRMAVTFSSPSGAGTAARLDVDYEGFVPPDLRRHTDAAMEALAPAALIYARYDVWPALSASAARAGVPTAMINATVRPGSARLRWPARPFLHDAYRSLDAVGAASESDRDRLESLGVRPEAIRVTGDASFDQAIARLSAAGSRPLRLPPRPPGIVRLIAGSTWPEDEAFLVAAVADLQALELILVPHEPTPEAVERIRGLVKQHLGVAPRLFSQMEAEGEAPVEPGAAPAPLLVDAVGFLAELYAEGDLGYVGGALAGSGLHSVIEPAAAGLPVLFGPRHDRWEAKELVAAGAAREVDPTSIYPTLISLLDPKRRRRMGQAALDYVAGHAGAGRVAAELVLDLLER